MKSTAPINTLEVQTSVFAAGYALWMLIGQPFHFATAAYLYLRTVDEWVWALLLLVGVTVHFVGALAGGVRLRQLGLIMLGLIQFVMTLCVLAANVRLPGIWTHAVLAASALYCAVRLRLSRP